MLKTSFLMLSSFLLVFCNCAGSSPVQDSKQPPLDPVDQDWQLSKQESEQNKDNNSDWVHKEDVNFTADSIFRGRDLSLYEITTLSKHETGNSKHRKMRTFIWKCWKEKQRGYINESFRGIDVSAVIHIFIEPDENRGWRIAWQIQRTHYPDGNSISYTEAIVEVDRIDTGSGDWKLVFKNKAGKILKEL